MYQKFSRVVSTILSVIANIVVGLLIVEKSTWAGFNLTTQCAERGMMALNIEEHAQSRSDFSVSPAQGLCVDPDLA